MRTSHAVSALLVSITFAATAAAQGAPPPAAPPVYQAPPLPPPGQGGPPPPPAGYPPPPQQRAPGAATPPAADAPPRAPRPVELFLALGSGSAFCDNKKPDSDCPVEGGGSSVGLGGGWRFHRRFSANLELSAWTFKVRDQWKGRLDNPATDVKFGSSYLALIGRYYFFAGESADAYLGFGVGVGSVKATAENAGGKYVFEAKGTVYPASIGVEWKLAPWFRLGPQGLIYLHKSTEICETTNGGTEICRSPRDARADGTKPEDGDGDALPWRIAVVGTFLLGGQ